MLQFRSFILLVFIFLYIGFTGAAPGRYALQQRDDTSTLSNSVVSNSASQTSSASDSGNSAAATSSVVLSSASESVAATSSVSSSISLSQASTTTSSFSTQTTTSGSIETGLFNSTLTPNLLPITPKITPAFSVAGVLLMITGCIYTFVGIKSKRLHIFFSASYLTSLAITVLIIYIMNPPISNGIEGAYLVAIVIPGLVVGGAAIIFPDLTEGIGCILGGFCFAMWLLVLKRGGLLTSESGICILIAVFCVASFAASFSRYTRPYGLIGSLSFAGATAIVLGIDCFSRAGLKEFWVWIWNLNSDLFSLGATSYPITRGIRVEIAAIFVIFLAGVVSQMRLWKVVAKRRGDKKLRRKQEEEDHERQEQDVGRQIAERSGQERDQWEAVYGDGERLHVPKQSLRSIADSGVGDMDSPKKTPRSTITSIHRGSSEEEIEMTAMKTTAAPKSSESVMSLNRQDGSVTVRVASDDRDEITTIPEHFEDDQEGHGADNGAVRSDGNAGELVEASSERKDTKPKTSSVPEIIPIPFEVPDARSPTSDDDRSSVATYNDEDPSPQRKRFSTNNPLKRLSMTAMRNSQRLSGFGLNRNGGWSKMSNSRNLEVLDDDDRRSSVAATIDGISDKDDLESLPADMTATSPLASNSQSTAIEDPTASEDKKTRPVSMSLIELQRTSFGLDKTSLKKEEEKSRPRSLSLAETVAISNIESSNEELLTPKDSVVAAKPPSLTEEVLPPTPSKVVMSYRTNEWAKHLSHAEIPAVETLKLERPSRPRLQRQVNDSAEDVADDEGQDDDEDIDNEIPAPLDIRALQQTATNATPPPAPRLRSRENSRSSRSSMSRAQQQHVSRSPSGISPGQQPKGHKRPPQAHLRMQQGSKRSSSGIRQSLQRSVSAGSTNADINDGNNRHRSTSTPALVPLYAHAASNNATSAPNLLSQRQSLMKQKHSFMALTPLASTPEFHATGSVGEPSTPGFSEDSASAYSRSIYAPSEQNGKGSSEQERLLSDDMSLKERKALIMKERERESTLKRTSGSLRVDTQQIQAQQRNSSSLSRSRQSSLGQTPAQREALMASWRASVQEDLQGVNRQRSVSPLVNAGGYGNGFGMGGNVAGASSGRLSAMQEREIEIRREQLFEEKRMEGFMTAMRKEEHERRSVDRDNLIRGGALDGRSGLEGAHREVMRRLQKKVRDV